MLDLKDLTYARSQPGYPTEAQEQMWLIQWTKRHGPDKSLHLLHIPNGGGRSKAQGAALKLQGVQPGVPDLFLPVACNGCHGLWIELKSTDPKTKPSDDQDLWLTYLSLAGYRAIVCHGFEAARDAILTYLDESPSPTQDYI